MLVKIPVQFPKPLTAICIAHDFICSSNKTIREWVFNCFVLRCVAIVSSKNRGEVAACGTFRLCRLITGEYQCLLRSRNLLHVRLACLPFHMLYTVCSHPGYLCSKFAYLEMRLAFGARTLAFLFALSYPAAEG